jgi:LysM repeat protein
MAAQNSIFDLSTKFKATGPFEDWMQPRNEDLEAKKSLAGLAQQEGNNPPEYKYGDYLVFNANRLFLIRNYQKSNEKIIWSTPSRSGNGKYLNDPKHVDKKQDPKTHIGGPIPKGWYYVDLSDFTANKNSGDKKIKKGTTYKGYQPDRKGGGWGEWAKPLYPYYWNNEPGKYGRDGFFLHEDGNEHRGGVYVGSGGCIATVKKEHGIRFVMECMKKAYNNNEGHLWVHVNYEFKSPVKFIKHKVKKNQNLYRISMIYGVTIAAIKKANNLKSDTILTDQILLIPVTSCSK